MYFLACSNIHLESDRKEFSKMVFKGVLGPKLRSIPDGPSLGQAIFDSIAKENGDSVVIVDLKNNKSITYNELKNNWTTVTKNLKNFGINKSDIIAVISENSWKYYLPLLAGFSIGAPVHLVNPEYTIHELRHILSLSKPKIIFSTPKTIPRILQLKTELRFIKFIVSFEDDVMETDVISFSFLISPDGDLNEEQFCENITGDHTALICNSSGTTGLPKGVMLTHEGLLHILASFHDPEFCLIKPGESQLLFLPLFHVYGANLLIMGLLQSNIKSIIMDKFNPIIFLQSIQKYRIRSLCLVPTLMNFMARTDLLDQYDLSSLQEIISSGSAPNEEVCKIVCDRLKLKYIRHLYGMTESVTCIAITSSRDSTFGSVGKPFPGRQVVVRDLATRKSLLANETGEICVKGPIMKGYINDPGKTLEATDDEGFLLTGDIGYYDENGKIYIVDRLKDLIKYKSFQVPPSELEDVLLKHPAVKDTAVVGKPDDRVGELPVAFVVKQINEVVSEKELIDHVSEYLSVQKRLYGGVKFVDEIPKNLTGKTLRKELRKMLISDIKTTEKQI